MEAAAPAPHILLVDDEGPLLQSLRRATLARGIAVDTATDGRRAWQLLQQRPYDLVVTDLRMPHMDGLELLGHLHAHQPTTRVIVMTGYASLDAAVECLRKGAVDFLTKPFPLEAFLNSTLRALQASPVTGADAEPDWRVVFREWKLSPRQGEILVAFYRTGRTNLRLAEDLAVSPHTIKSHLRVAFQRAGVRSRSQLLQRLHEFRR